MLLNPNIFRAYDIRGKAFIDFDEDGFFIVAAAFGKHLSRKWKKTNPKIFVSGDGRTSMGQLWPSLVAGLESVGCIVTWGGIIPTPINYFALHQGNFDGSIQITASHNPFDENGLKFTDKSGAVAGEEIQQIKALADCNECRKTKNFGVCREECQIKSYLEPYTQKLESILSPQKSKKIVVDAGNSVAGMFYPDLFRHFGHEIEELYCDLNTMFPNHQPDPEEPENLKDLIEEVQTKRADFGLAYDGDGDRVGVILSDGTPLLSDQLFYILAADFLSRNPGEKIVIDAMTSATLIEKLENLGGQMILSPTGHSHIENAMHEHKALLGGEQSGHYMFGENFYGHDDAALASLRFLSALENHPEYLTQATDEWPNLLEYSKKFEVPDDQKFQKLEQIIQDILAQNPKAKINQSDGLRLDFGQGEWAIIRCSNTSPKISVRIEANTQESLDEKIKLLTSWN